MQEYIIGCSHHKTGTVLLSSILKDLTSIKFAHLPRWLGKWCQLELGPYMKDQEKINPNALDIVPKPPAVLFSNNSKFYDSLDHFKKFKCVHIVRHPFEIVCSGYKYHTKCEEAWLTSTKYKKYDKSYQAILKSLSEEEGVNFEIENVAGTTIKNMMSFEYYNDDRFMHVRLEDFYLDFESTLQSICEFIGFSYERLIKKSYIHNKFDKDFDSAKKHVTNKSEKIYIFDELLSNKHKNKINKLIKEHQQFDFMKKFSYDQKAS